jgi:UDP-N-acetylglucosamine transferase subunit ALG13
VILVTLGTHQQPMDRLVAELDRLIESGVVEDDVLVQAAAFGRRPQRAKALGVVPFDELEALARRADVVVTHGGPGSIMLALAHGRAPVVVPRDPAHGEHVDDHQLRFVQWLAARRPIRPVTDVADLGIAIAEARGRAVQADVRAERPAARAVDRLRAIVAGR